MVNDYFRLGGLTISVDSKNGICGESAFRCEADTYDLKIRVDESADFHRDPNSKTYARSTIRGSEISLTVNPAELGPMTDYRLFNAFDLPAVLLEHGHFLIHSSYIVYNGEAILFTGNSGIGKSTQAEYWRRERNAEVVNGDRCLVCSRDGRFLANGYINSGSSGICKNVTAPLKAIVVLGQADKNTVIRLGGVEAFKSILPQCTYNTTSVRQIELVTSNLSDLITNVKVLRLDCVNSPTAVECLEKYL